MRHDGAPGRATRRTRRRFAASCTTPRRGAWAASPGTPGCSAPRAICRALRGCCWRRPSRRRCGCLSARDRGEDDVAGDAGRHGRACAASAGTSTRRSRRTAASCFRSARTVTPASPARRSGSIRRRSSYVIFLSSRLHPDGKGDVTPLRGQRRDGCRGGARASTAPERLRSRRARPAPSAPRTWCTDAPGAPSAPVAPVAPVAAWHRRPRRATASPS